MTGINPERADEGNEGEFGLKQRGLEVPDAIGPLQLKLPGADRARGPAPMHQGMGPGLRFEEKPIAETHFAAVPALPKYQH